MVQESAPAARRLTFVEDCNWALLLGYAEQSSFTRAFRHWFGTVPSAWRRHWSQPRSQPRPRLAPD